jgi:hypothetical protein
MPSAAFLPGIQRNKYHIFTMARAAPMEELMNAMTPRRQDKRSKERDSLPWRFSLASWRLGVQFS